MDEPSRPKDDAIDGSAAAALFSGHSTLALVADSETLDIDRVQAELPDDTLFVFFTGCPRILRQPFRRKAILVHRMTDAATFSEGERAVDQARAKFAAGSLKAEIGIVARDGGNTPAKPAALARNSRVAYVLELDEMFANFYTPGMTPTTGFALAMWLVEGVRGADVCLCGFTGVRGPRFGMRTMHDWALEQTLIKLFSRHRRLRTLAGDESGREMLSSIGRRFPQIPESEIALVASDVLSDRINALDLLVAKLWSVSRAPRALYRFAARWRPGAAPSEGK